MPLENEVSLSLPVFRSSLVGHPTIALDATEIAAAFEKKPNALILFKSEKEAGSVFVAKYKDLFYYFKFEKFSDAMYVETKSLGMRRHPVEEAKIHELIQSKQVYISPTLLNELDALITQHQLIQTNFIAGTELLAGVLASGRKQQPTFDRNRVYIIQSRTNPHLFEINWHHEGRLNQAAMYFNPQSKTFHSERLDFLKQAMAAGKIVVDINFKDKIESLIGINALTTYVHK